MNAESSLLELSEIFANENKKSLDEFKQKLENLILTNDLDSSSLELITQLKTALNEVNAIHDLTTLSEKLEQILEILSKLKPKAQQLTDQGSIQFLKECKIISGLILEKTKTEKKYQSILTSLMSTKKSDQKMLTKLQNLSVNLEDLLEILEDKGDHLSLEAFIVSEKFVSLLLDFVKSNFADSQNNIIQKYRIKNFAKKIYRSIFTILGLINYLKREKEKNEPSKPTNSFREFVKRLDLTPEEQLEKNKPAMELLQKWMKRNREMTEEEKQEAREAFESFKEIIDAERPEGYKLYSDL